ncbi:Copper resistance protein B [Granulibacter bethesdensis CGDNIH1]|uniref:Copper resistance protein B n=2 Tax=Granulibacter bethesdensis TaxID=364410 RepID=Q0BQH5_GRABC|nr:Copper resistance protein B [Granulibacter bethesdensis CGDNIH1]APH52794.1 Copper resistance protein B [Granulibacter bethesdensis]APH65482.1 Copper resistance protein B [Granulibacter bethesdensis]
MGVSLPSALPYGTGYVPHRGGVMNGLRRIPHAVLLLSLILLTGGTAAGAGMEMQATGKDGPVYLPGGPMPAMDDQVYLHALLEQAEHRMAGTNQVFTYEGEAWLGTDENKLWLKSEGTVGKGGGFQDARHEVLYDRPFSTYFDWQAGWRIDLDNGPTRQWAAFGVQGLTLYFFDLEATAYLGTDGRVAARVEASYDLLLTNRLILQPRLETNWYGQSDPARGLGAGVSNLETGIRLRYEFARTFAPYLGVVYQGAFGRTGTFQQQQGQAADSVRFLFGLRLWF